MELLNWLALLARRSSPAATRLIYPKILVGGFFTQLSGYPRNYIGLLNTGGSLDLSFDPSADSLITGVSIQQDGKMLAGGYFTQLGGQPRSSVGRLSADIAAQQNLDISSDGQTIIWRRSGSGPELDLVIFELSTEGGPYTFIGSAQRISGGWQISGANLPLRQNLYIRARGFYSMNGSGSIIESVRNIYLTAPIPMYLPLVIR